MIQQAWPCLTMFFSLELLACQVSMASVAIDQDSLMLG